jgi:hypothetical protein
VKTALFIVYLVGQSLGIWSWGLGQNWLSSSYSLAIDDRGAGWDPNGLEGDRGGGWDPNG